MDFIFRKPYFLVVNCKFERQDFPPLVEMRGTPNLTKIMLTCVNLSKANLDCVILKNLHFLKYSVR